MILIDYNNAEQIIVGDSIIPCVGMEVYDLMQILCRIQEELQELERQKESYTQLPLKLFEDTANKIKEDDKEEVAGFIDSCDKINGVAQSSDSVLVEPDGVLVETWIPEDFSDWDDIFKDEDDFDFNEVFEFKSSEDIIPEPFEQENYFPQRVITTKLAPAQNIPQQMISSDKSDETLIERVSRICSGFVSKSFFVANSIPVSRLSVAKQCFPIPQNVEVLALLDTTFVGTGGRGIAFCTDGFRWSENANKGFLEWKVLLDSVIVTDPMNTSRIKIEKYPSFECAMGMEVHNFLLLIGALKSELAPLLKRTSQGNKATPLTENPFEIEELAPNLPLCLPTQNQNSSVTRPQPTTSIPARGTSRTSPMQITGKKLTPRIEQPQRSIAKVDINNAPLEDLLVLPGVSKGQVETLVAERKLRRGFKSLDEVTNLLELQPHQIGQLQERIKIVSIVDTKPVSSARSRVIDF